MKPHTLVEEEGEEGEEGSSIQHALLVQTIGTDAAKSILMRTARPLQQFRKIPLDFTEDPCLSPSCTHHCPHKPNHTPRARSLPRKAPQILCTNADQ